MSYRHDAVYGFAKICAEAIDRANEIGDPLVLTFGKVIPKPNTVNVVPEKWNLQLTAVIPTRFYDILPVN